MVMYTDEADLNAVVRAVGLLDVSVSKSKARLNSRRRPTASVRLSYITLHLKYVEWPK